MPRSHPVLALLLVLPLACAFLPAGRGISRDLAMMARKKNNTSTEAKHRRASDMMASFTFKDYLADVMASKEEFEGLPAEIKERYRIDGYSKWLELKSQPTSAPGNVHPRSFSSSMLSFESSTLHCLVLALTAFVCL